MFCCSLVNSVQYGVDVIGISISKMLIYVWATEPASFQLSAIALYLSTLSVPSHHWMCSSYSNA